MISDADYQELKAAQRDLNPEGRAALREYELSNPQHVATGALGASGVTKLREGQTEEVPPAPAPEVGQVPKDVAPDTVDHGLPNASGLKSLLLPPEYVAKNPLSGLKHVAVSTAIDPLDGPGVGAYHEPSDKQFQSEMKDVLRASGIPLEPDDTRYQEKLAEYRDRKWAQAYTAAQQSDTPLTRVAYAPHSTAWEKLKSALEQAPDVASAFAKGFASGGTLHATEALETNADREQSERDPYARGAGELVGSLRTTGPLAAITKGASGLAARVLPGGLFGRLAGAAVSGGVAGVADLAGRSAAEAVRGEPNAKERFAESLPMAALTGAGFGLGGHLLAEGGNLAQKSTLKTFPEVGQLRRGGGDTSILGGVKPGEDVAANVEAAREPIPGEAKAPPEGNATELAAKKVQQPLTEANAAAHTNTHATIAAEQEAAIAADPKLQEQLPATKTAQAAVDWALAKLQPEARPGYLPGVSKPLSAEVLPFADIAEVQKMAPRLWKPRIVNAADASSVANRARGRAITLDEARQLGIPLGDLSKGLNSEGVPLDAPPIPDAPLNVAETLPRYSKEQLANAGDVGDATPEQAAAIQRYTFGKRSDGDNELINDYLSKAPVSPLPHVYRGLTLSPDQAAEMLSQDTFSTGNTPTSVSSSPIVARSFVARNLEPGQVGVTLKLEHESARNIQPFAHDQVKVEGELMLPEKRTFEITGKHKDPTNPGNWIVTAKEVPSAPDAGTSTTEEVFGRPADKLTPGDATRLKPREGRAFKTPTGPVGSEWFDAAKAAETVALHSGDYAVKDPFARTPAPARGAGLDTPTTPGTPEDPPAIPSIRPTGAPSALRSPLTPPAPPTSASGPAIGGVPESEYRVILEPRRFDAKTFESILGDADRQAGAARPGAKPDPAWKQLQRAIREDRSQFGANWTDLIAKHHAMLNDVEQRSYHAGAPTEGAKPYNEMSGAQQQTLNGKLVDFPGGTDSAKALRELAAQASPAVQKDLEVLGAQNAYSKLKGMANPKIGETVGAGGVAGHLRGFGPAVKLRTDALARGVSAGPTGEPTITPRLVDFVKQNAPKPKYLPGIGTMGGGALGMKAGSVYNSTRDRGEYSQALTPAERKFLDELIQATQEAP